MKAAESMLCWTPDNGAVKVVRWPDSQGHSGPFQRTSLACWAVFGRMNKEQQKAMIFIEAMHLIIRDGMDPRKVHQALLEIDEYRDGLADDMPGLDRFRKERAS